MPAKADFDDMMRDELASAIKGTLRDARVPISRIWGVGIGIPGVVNIDRRTISTAPLIGVTEERSYRDSIERLEQQLKLPVFVENDANSAAIGEYMLRREQGEADLIYLSVGTGVGGGIILDGRLRKGMRFSAGEVGYMTFDRTSSSHSSKAGWLENRINHRALMKSKRSAQFLELAASDLALVIANLSSVLDVDLFVVGGTGLSDYGADFLARTATHVKQLSSFPVRIESPQNKEPGVIGAGAVVVDNILDQKMHA
jgi:predicted NBD/HSP70 family sugar kinase